MAPQTLSSTTQDGLVMGFIIYVFIYSQDLYVVPIVTNSEQHTFP